MLTEKDRTFSPIQLSSPKSYEGKNLTGYARHVRDLVADIHANIQRWNSLHLQGVTCLKNIAREKRDETYSEYLQELCDRLEVVCKTLDIVVKNLDQIQHQLKTVATLQGNANKLFTTWPTTKFGDVAETIYKTYYEEARSKRKILENVAHNHADSWKMLHLAAWEYQPSIPENITTLLEAALIETGHRLS